MTQRNRRITVLALICALTATPAVAAEPSITAPAAAPEITLVTGDRVSMHPAGRYRAVAGPGREHIRFIEWRRRDRTLVIPSDAVPLLLRGRLDERLFDPAYLAAQGFRDDLPLIVQGSVTARSGVSVVRRLATATALTVSRDSAAAVWPELARAGKVWLDGRVRATLDLSARQIGAPAAWSAGLTGKGVTVAVLDTGVDTKHPDLATAVIRSQDFSDSGHTGDGTGHGTHVASTIAGSGAASNGRYRGIAPDAKLLNGKVLNDQGSGSESGVISGMEWAAAQGAQIVNLSLGQPDQPGVDPMEEAIDRLTARHGTLFVAGAGNEGPDAETVYSPSTADAAISVGSVDKSDFIADHSSRGPRPGDLGLKPDLTAPGVDIVAARAGSTGYTALSGTSMATPHVSGAAAVLLQRRPGWTARELKPVLVGSARPDRSHTVDQQGAGRVDIGRSLRQQVFASPTSLNFGEVGWPSGPVRKTVAYRNIGSRPVTLSLQASAPHGMLTVAPRRLTIRPGQRASASVTLDPRRGPAGRFSAAVDASGLRVPVAVTKHIQTFAYTIRATGRDGRPAGGFGTILNTETQAETRFLIESGQTTVRLPKGRYAVIGTTVSGDDFVLFADPALRLTRDTVASFDARRSRPVTMSVPAPDARVVLSHVSLSYRHGPIRSDATGRVPVGISIGAANPGDARLSRVHLIPSRSGPRAFSTSLFGLWARPRVTDPDVHPIDMFRESPYGYHLARVHRGGVPAALSWSPRHRELARVDASYGSVLDDRHGHKLSNFSVDGSPLEAQFPWPLASRLPFRRTEYYAPGVVWDHTLIQEQDNASQDLESGIGRVTYRPGRRYSERWNAGVFAPGFGHPPILAGQYATRHRNNLSIRIPTFSGGAPGQSGFGVLTNQLTLHRGGDLLASASSPSLDLAVTPDRSRYRLTLDTTPYPGVAISRLSTKITTTWNFGSAYTATRRPLPLPTLRYSPPLDPHNRAPGNRRFRLPITLEGANSAHLHLEVSYNDGHSWTRPHLTATTRSWTATLHHPSSGFVSLRAHATTGSDTVTQTVLRAYQLA